MRASNGDINLSLSSHSSQPAAVEGFKLQATYPGHCGPISSIALHPKLPMVATASDDGQWKVWSLEKGELVMSAHPCEEGHWVGAVSMSPDGAYCVTGESTGHIRLWDLGDERLAKEWHQSDKAIWDINFDSSGKLFISKFKMGNHILCSFGYDCNMNLQKMFCWC